MRRIALFSLSILFFLSGCATNEYARYAEMQERIQIAKYTAEAERYKAMASIGLNGDTTTKVAAMMSMAGFNSNNQNQTAFIQPPKTAWENTRDVLSIFLPAFVQGYGIYASSRTAQNASDNARMTSMSTNDAFIGMAGKIQAPASNVNTTYTLSGTGVIGNGTYSTVDTHPTSTTYTYSNAYNDQPVTTTTTSNCNVAPCP